MPSLVSTASGTSSNSYVSVSEADVYFGERLNATAWTAASTDDKERALIMATRRIDQERFLGWKTVEQAALKWPRDGVYDDDGDDYDSSVVPDIVKQATYELALKLLADGTSDYVLPTGLEEFRRAKVGSLEVERDPTFRAGELPDNVRRLLRPVISTAGSSARIFLS